MKKTLQKRMAILVFLLGIAGNFFAQDMTLVSETDFSCSYKPNARIASIDEVDGFGNSLIEPSLSTSLTLASTTKSTDTTSDFLGRNTLFAITSNPSFLDERRLINEDVWGFVISGMPTNSQAPILGFSVSGLKPNSNYRVEVEMCLPLSEDFLADMNSYNSKLKVSVNNTMAGQSGTSSKGFDKNTNKSGDTERIIISYTNGRVTSTPNNGANDSHAIGNNGRLEVRIFMPQGGPRQAVMIKSIKVYGVVGAQIQGGKAVCIGGETVTLSASKKYYNSPDSAYTWYKDGAMISEKGLRITHTSEDTAGTHSYYYVVSVPDKEGNIRTIKSEDHTVEDQICCMDDKGNPTSQKLIWQEDFGTFTSDSTYWTWDYSDMNAPKKVTHNDGNQWTACFGLSIPGTECDKSPSEEGKYTVAGNVTCQYDGVTGGTQWGWEAICFNGKYPRENGYTFVPDHTYQGSDFGGMLFINGGNNANDVIYAKKISSSELKGRNITARCFVNTFSDDANPVKVYMKLTDLSSGNYVTSNTVTKYTIKDGLAWQEANVSVSTEGDSVLVEIINVVGGEEYNRKGNDLILDDIQLYVCGEAGFPTCTLPKEPVIYANGKDVKSIHLKSGESVTLTSNDVTATDKDGNPYSSYTMSWHKDNAESKPIKKTFGVVADSLVVVWEDADKNGTTFILKVMDNIVDMAGNTTDACNRLDTITVYAGTTPDANIYCEDSEGRVIPQTLIWQEDFGTFTSDSTYWTWDYSDLNAPKKVTHSNAKKWSTCYGLEIPRTECTPSPFDQGSFTVAGNVTSAADGVGGTQWGYESMCFNGKYPSENGFTFVPDHTYEGSAFGGMLFVNGDSEIGDVIYSKKISSSKLKGRDVTARCFVNTFADAQNPVKIHIQVTDLKTGVVVKSESVTRNSIDEGLDWKEVTITSSIEGDSILVEVVYDCGDSQYNRNGNDLILDDIQLFVCEEENTSSLDIYCEDSEGKLIPQKLVWQEDFGTFTSDSTYWTWDYSDLNAPKKVTHSNAKKWSTCYGLEIPRTECTPSPFDQGSFTVAGNVTSAADGVGGTQWGYESMCFNGKYPSENGFTFVPDHTYEGSAFGGMLFVNGDSEIGDVIYSKKISSSKLKGRDVTARCFVNTFADAQNPVKIHIQVTDLKTGVVVKSESVTRNSIDEGLDWKEVTITSSIEGDSILVEVVYDCGDSQYNRNGNDLILDDIQLFTCTSTEHVGVETQPAAEMDEMVNVYTISGIIVKTNVKRSEALNGLKKGSYYIVGHEKVLVDL